MKYKKSDMVKIRKVHIINGEDLLYFAEANGYSWNEAHDILFERYGKTETLRFGMLYKDHFTELSGFNYSKELTELMLAFFNTYDLKEVYLTEKGHECYS